MAAPRDEDLLLVDAYVDMLLSRETPGLPAPFPADPRIAAAARGLHTSLARFHPSFRFEDRLAARLRATATGGDVAGALRPTAPSADPQTPPAIVIPFPAGPATIPAADGTEHGRGLLLGGAIASGVSLAGAALYAWRRQRDGRFARDERASRSLARAARAAHRLGGSGGRGSVIVAARLSGRLAARRQREGLA